MILHPSKKMSAVIHGHFEKMLLAGAFPEIEYSNTNGFKHYLLFEYSNTHARLAKLVDLLIKTELNEPLGIFSRKQSTAFLAQVQGIVEKIGEQDIRNNPERFRSFADGVLAEALR